MKYNDIKPDIPHEPIENIEIEDLETAQSSLQAITERVGDDIAAPLVEALAACADPLKAIVSLDRFLERSISATTEAGLMVSSPRLPAHVDRLVFPGYVVVGHFMQKSGIWRMALDGSAT